MGSLGAYGGQTHEHRVFKLPPTTAWLLAGIDAKIQALIASDAALLKRQERLQTIVGIGPQISAVLAAVLSRYEFANVRAVIAYSGLDPRPNDSGGKRGRRVLSKRGPAGLRRMLWLAALSASHSKAFSAVYQSIKSRGFSGTQALVILARKMRKASSSEAKLWCKVPLEKR